MRLKAIICEVLAREVYDCAARSANIVDVELLEKELHTIPSDLGAELQHRIDAVPMDRYDAVVLAYGLCGTAIAGLRARHVPIVVPRAHDCITLYLGSGERYRDLFTGHPGTYYYTPDYVERGGTDSVAGLGANDEGKMQSQYDEYVAKYGEENATYLMEVMGAWRDYYDQATYIDIEGLQLPDYRDKVRELAARRGWAYNEIQGRPTLVQKLIDADWDEGLFLRVEPGQMVVATYGSDILRADPASAEKAASRFLD